MNNETTASQPKSIGDDALFHDAMMHFLTHATTAKLLRKQPEYLAIAAMFDSCVSVPIKAAPSVSTVTLTGHQLVAALDLLAPGLPRDPEELDCDLTFGVVQHKDDDGAVATGMCCWNDDTDGVLPLDEHPNPAATIQEPVMVAEPVMVSLGDTWADSCKVCQQRADFGIATQKGPDGCREAVESGETYCSIHINGALSLAAPMVADPAGVALTVWCGAMPESNGKSNFTALLMRKGGDMVDGITLERSEYPDRVRYEADRVRYLLGELPEPPFILDYDADKHSGYVPLAATVKAVPSEAQSRRVGVPENMIQWAVRELLGALPERRDWLNPDAEAVLRAEFQRAAPLADKTGGGE